MEFDKLQLEDIGVQLGLILSNRLLFETKEEFARYVKYSVDKNNSVAGIQYERQVAIMKELTEKYLEPTGYTDFAFFFTMYSRASRFFLDNFEGKKLLEDEDCALKMAWSLYYSHQLTGERKLDLILEKLFDYELEYPKRPRIDFDILILIVLGVLPPMGVRGPRAGKEPDFEKEWETVLEFISECVQFNDLFVNNPILGDLRKRGEDSGFHKSRFFFLEAVTSALGYIDRVTRPQQIGKDFFYYDLPGLWQNWVGKHIPEKNVYYQFMFASQGYNLVRYEVYPSAVKRSLFYSFFAYDGDTRVLHIDHPRGTYRNLIGEKVEDNDWVKYQMMPFPENEDAPTELKLSPYMGGHGFPLMLERLKKVDDEDAERILADIESPDRVIEDQYEEFLCIYPIPEGIYAITKTDIYIIDPDDENAYYKVPKSINEYLDTLSVDSKAGIFEAGKEKTKWIGFDPIALYISPEQMEELGIERVGRIE